MARLPHCRTRSKLQDPHSLKYLVTYRRELWQLDTDSRRRRFATLDAALALIARITRWNARGGRPYVTLEYRTPDGRWQELPQKDGRVPWFKERNEHAQEPGAKREARP
jgi:hypothetical protein